MTSRSTIFEGEIGFLGQHFLVGFFLKKWFPSRLVVSGSILLNPFGPKEMPIEAN